MSQIPCHPVSRDGPRIERCGSRECWPNRHRSLRFEVIDKTKQGPLVFIQILRRNWGGLSSGYSLQEGMRYLDGSWEIAPAN